MLFNSTEFIFIFLPLTISLFYFLGSINRRVAITTLVLTSLFFYAYWDPKYVIIILSSIFINYALGAKLSKTNNKPVLTFGILINIICLGYYKYTNFLVDNLNFALNSNYVLEKIVLPIGISFFTFQQIGFLVDSYKGKTKEYNFENYMLFVTFFPQLIAGPIVHHKEVIPQFASNKVFFFRPKNILIGLFFFSIGLFKKVGIADSFSIYSNQLFSAPSDTILKISSLQAWLGALSYTFQLYFDFSGYSDMAVGLAKLFNINLTYNFNSPYKSSSISEFWRRWHITLSNFLKDYLYVPLGGSRTGDFKTYRNLLVTMLLGGIWHGAGWNFLIWGAIHGTALVINHFWKKVNFKSKKLFSSGLISYILTMLIVVIGWVFFRATEYSTASYIIKKMFSFELVSAANIIRLSDYKLWTILVLGIFAVKYLPNTQELIYKDPNQRKQTRFNIKYFTLFTSIIMALSLFLIVYNKNRVHEFLYFDF